MSSDFKSLLKLLKVDMVEISIGKFCLTGKYAGKYTALKETLPRVLLAVLPEDEEFLVKALLMFALDHIDVDDFQTDAE